MHTCVMWFYTHADVHVCLTHHLNFGAVTGTEREREREKEKKRERERALPRVHTHHATRTKR